MADLTTLDEATLKSLGQRLFSLWPTYKTDRRMIEERWLKNLRATRKIHDPEVLRLIPADRSKAYPGVTQWIVRGTIARLMQLLYPNSTEKNYGVKTSPLPDISVEQLQQVLDGLVIQKSQDGTDPRDVMLSDEEIEKAILEFAKGKAERMEIKVSDDLQEMDFVTLIRKVVRSAVVYNIGILKGPFNVKTKARTWKRNEFTGKYEAIEVDKYKPLFEFLPVWSWYPDMSAKDINHRDGDFERLVLSRADVQALAARPDFLADQINTYLAKHEYGNYQMEWYEQNMKAEPKSGQASVQQELTRKFVVLRWLGGVTGKELRAAGAANIKDEELGRVQRGDVWMIDDVVIKAKVIPFDEAINQYHIFCFEEDDLSILGSGQCDVVRDSQLSIGECARALLDNISVCGPMAEVNDDLLTPGQDTNLRKHKTWHRESSGGNSDAIPAVRDIHIDPHVMELKAAIELFMQFLDLESGLPPPSVGNVSGGGSEALRTSKNASMFLGAAALPIRDTVRNFDTFIVSAISALVAWNMRFDPNPSRDGDHQIIARGSTSLIAKEVLATNLNEFRASITPDEAPHLKPRKMLIERAKANDIPIDDFLEDESVANETIQRNAQAQQDAQKLQEELVHAQAEEMLTKAFEHVAKAQAESAGTNVSVAQLVIDALAQGHKAAAAHDSNTIAAHTATKPAPAPVKAAA